ncbi:MAG: hypothetical protein M3163_15540, partial [Actinomycetota bacterium]|nr:hypothetical protein [Actinomycetota bacterium]
GSRREGPQVDVPRLAPPTAARATVKELLGHTSSNRFFYGPEQQEVRTDGHGFGPEQHVRLMGPSCALALAVDLLPPIGCCK